MINLSHVMLKFLWNSDICDDHVLLIHWLQCPNFLQVGFRRMYVISLSNSILFFNLKYKVHTCLWIFCRKISAQFNSYPHLLIVPDGNCFMITLTHFTDHFSLGCLLSSGDLRPSEGGCLQPGAPDQHGAFPLLQGSQEIQGQGQD